MKVYKKSKAYILATLLSTALISTGCDDFLELEPQGVESSVTFMTVQDNAEQAVIGLYNLLSLGSGSGPDGDWVDNHLESFYGSIISDDAEKGSQPSDNPSGLTNLSQFQLTSSLVLNKYFWIHGFWGVSRANFVIAQVTDANFDPAVKDRMLGEAYFFRAYWNYYLLQKYGALPLLKHSIQTSEFGNIPRASYTETFEFIIEDLKKAESLLPDKEDYTNDDLGRVAKGTARGMLARVHMYSIGTDPESKSTWTDVYNATSSVINSGSYMLVPNYATLFEDLEDPDGDYRRESMFEYTGKDGRLTSGTVLFVYTMEGSRGSFGWGFNQPTQNLVDAYDTTDPRLSNVVWGYGFNNQILYGRTAVLPDRGGEMMTNYYSRKSTLYTGESGQDGRNQGNSKAVFILRYADVLLMHAEACYYLDKEAEARQYVNMVRKRARESSYCQGYVMGTDQAYTYPATTPNVPDLDATYTGQKLLEAIWLERRLELAQENQRTFDLIRTGRLYDRVVKVKDQERTGGSGPLNTNNGAEQEIRIADIGENIKRYCKQVTVPGENGGLRYLPLLQIPETETTYWNINPN